MCVSQLEVKEVKRKETGEEGVEREGIHGSGGSREQGRVFLFVEAALYYL